MTTGEGLERGGKGSRLASLLPAWSARGPSVVSLKFTEEQPQILRLTTPELKDVRGPVRSE
jgi:hypothetical protein